MAFYDDYPRYETVGERRQRAQRQIAKLQKKNPHLAPVLLPDKRLAATWWGKAWNKNLEHYADYANRISRGRSYLRMGAVIDLQIAAGLVTAQVQGTRARPYQVTVTIAPLDPDNWARVQRLCQRRIENLAQLVEGKFPQDLAEIFTLHGQGIFPHPREIQFTCTCPDGAYMCKHVAAVLYGIGARFDQDPTLFFRLRGIDFADLMKKSIEDKMHSLLENAQRPSPRVLTDADINTLFDL